MAKPKSNAVDFEQTCANCGKPYAQHLVGTYCRIGNNLKWFPQGVADAIIRATENIEKDAS